MPDTITEMLSNYVATNEDPAARKRILDLCFPSLPTLVRKACEMYHEDTLAPSVVTSLVRNEWYVSVVRWRGPRKELTRQVLFGVTNADLEAAYAEALRRLS